MTNQALDLPADERADFLARESDDEIRFEAERLLAAIKRSEKFIDEPFLIEEGIVTGFESDIFAGEKIGDYLPDERIGAGGTGAVYLATRLNSDFTQKVALKIIKRGMNSEAVLTRLSRERKILSTLKFMKKIFLLLICLGLFASFNFAQKQSPSKTNAVKKVKINSQNRKKDKQNFVCQLPARVISLELNRTGIIADRYSGDNLCAANKMIQVATAAIISGEDKYLYTVSAGKVIGEGANVERDLSGVKPGTYTITAAIDQFHENWGWQVFGETKTQTIIVK